MNCKADFRHIAQILFGVILLFHCTITWSNNAVIAFQEIDQDFLEFKGKVVDAQTKKILGFATISIADSNVSTITNSDGEFLLKVPQELSDRSITINFLGYQPKTIPLSELTSETNIILLVEAQLQLSEIKIDVPKDAQTLVKIALSKKNENYLADETVMTAFYRETIKKRRRNASLSEAVVEIFRYPFSSSKSDKVKLIKARKSSDYNRLDTLAIKLQGGPFSALYADIVKYPQYVFMENDLDHFEFKFDTSTEINNRVVYVINFKPLANIIDPLHHGTLYIDAQTSSIISAVYSLDVSQKELAAALFVKKKPNNVKVYPTEATYRVDYRYKDGKWHYGYSSIYLTFKVNWKKRLFNSVYTISSEMAITDWEKNFEDDFTKKETLKPSFILADEASGFSDPKFWGEYNIIEPEKSIESAIEKINKQLLKLENTKP